MIARNLGCRLVALALLAAILSGCQRFNSSKGLHLPWSKTSRLGEAPAPPPSPAPEPLRPEQKADIQIAMARTLQNQGRTEDAKKMYLEAVKLAPQRADAYHFLALLHDRKGECREAEPFYQQALQIDDQNAAVHCDLGYSYYLQQRWAEAETQLRRALELDSDLKRGHNNLGLLLARTGREREAWEEFRLAGIGPAEAHTNLAYVYTMLDRWTDAEAEYQQALAIDPRLKPAQEGLAKLRSLAAKRGTGPAEMARR